MIYQTISNLEHIEQVENVIKGLENTHVQGIRFNFCKVYFKNMINIYASINDLISNYPDFKYSIDIPYPYNKSRIISYSVPEGKILKDKEYYICSNSHASTYINTIFLNCEMSKGKEVGDTIYFGDGEGAFKIQEYTNSGMLVTAENNFKIYNNKAILCNLVMNEEICFNLLAKIKKLYPLKELDINLSFVQKEDEVINVRRNLGSDQRFKIISKIEAVFKARQIKKLISLSDGAMLARGDMCLLGEMSSMLEVCESVSQICLKQNKKIILATDILNSLAIRNYPSRADIMDLCIAKSLKCTDIILANSCENRERVLSILQRFGF